MSGAYDSPQVECTPVATAELLEGKDVVKATDINTALSAGPHNRVNSLSFGGAKLDDAALDELKSQLPQLSSLEILDLSNSTGFTSSALKELLSACCGCETLKRVCLAGCGLKSADVIFITSDVAPWSETIVDWDLSNNPLVGGAAILGLVSGLSNRPIQALNVTNTGINDARNGGAILTELLNLPHLIQLGIGRNAGVLAPTLKNLVTEVDNFLKNNAEMSGIREQHISIAAVIGKEAGEEKKKEEAEAEVAAAAAAKAAKSVPKKTSSPLKKRASSPAAQSPAPPQTSTTSTIKRGSSPARKPVTTTQTTSAPKTPVRRAASPSVARSSTPVGLASTPRSPSRQANLSQAISQKDVADGYQEWLEIKAKYNECIHSGHKKKPPAEGEKDKPKYYTYKYAFGKSVDAQKQSGSRAFHNTTIVRDPTSQELRELAPWVTNKDFVSCPGRTIYVDDPKNPGRKIRFVDGGEIRDVAHDPREIGFVARKRESGQLASSRTGGFASNTPREVRFGTDATNEVIRRAQAPGPGAYYVKSQFEINAEKAKINASNRPAFGSKSERMVFKKPISADEQPATFYEIP